MNLQQLEYVVAVDNHRHFLHAAQECFITQATLSMMIQKLENELDIKIFDRSKKPVKPTEIGKKIIVQARRILAESEQLKQIVLHEKGEVSGELKVGIIPTLAPYLLPKFLKKFTTQFPLVKLNISEHTTATIIERLKTGALDTAIVATPLGDKSLKEHVLFYERYFLYINDKEKGFNKQYVLPADIDVDQLWLLEEGHCMRAQILNLCELKKQHEYMEKLHYSAGSIETLKNLVEQNFGITIIPELAVYALTPLQKKRIRQFKPPAPVREISIVTHRDYVKNQLIQALKEVILSKIPPEMKINKRVKILDI